MGLEETAHLSITWTRVTENQEMDLEGSHVNCDWNYNETKDTSAPVTSIGTLREGQDSGGSVSGRPSED